MVNFFFYKGVNTQEINFERTEENGEKKELQTVKLMKYFLKESGLVGAWYHRVYGDKYYGSLEVTDIYSED